MSDEAFHEIELKGKQLVFLFMAGTVVAVVIFLCGVMVGRGVRAPLSASQPVLASDELVDPTLPATAASAGTSSDAPATAGETLTYASRLEADRPVAESLRDPVPAASNIPDVPAEPIPEPAPEPRTREAAAVPAAAPAMTEPAGGGYVVQVMAARTRAEADRIAGRLGEKGYPAFVTTAGGASPTPYRVRVGKYNNLRDAESMAKRLKDKEQFKTWITR